MKREIEEIRRVLEKDGYRVLDVWREGRFYGVQVELDGFLLYGRAVVGDSGVSYWFYERWMKGFRW